MNPHVVEILLPVGISFYTFHSISYKVDVYKMKYEPVKNLIDFAIYIGFFPLLVAGPIERGHNLLPQITHPRKLTSEKVISGIYLLFSGFFKKVVIADNLSLFVSQGFSNINSLNVITAILTINAFAWQIYCDFSGYTDIARGVSKLLGIDLMLNFNLPYFSKNPAEFWKRWHISLSSWLRDYLYIPLGGNRKGEILTCRNLFLTMLLGGLWHGASWNFIIWGAFQGTILIGHRLFIKMFPNIKIPSIINIVLCYNVTCIGWIFFRANSLSQITDFFNALTNINGINPDLLIGTLQSNKYCMFLIPLFIIQILQYVKNDSLIIFKLQPMVRPAIYILMTLCILLFGRWESEAFLYFQF